MLAIMPKILTTQNKEKLLKAAIVKGQFIYKGMSIIITDNYLIETLKLKRDWKDVFQVLKYHKCQARPLYPAKLPTMT